MSFVDKIQSSTMAIPRKDLLSRGEIEALQEEDAKANAVIRAMLSQAEGQTDGKVDDAKEAAA